MEAVRNQLHTGRLSFGRTLR
ncbi:MAG: hypothetical protein JWM11_7711, partial [Planctomycetaceae bacterium]|nr:hypothetical protein [Planctomycetaceae bacterium]